MRTRAPMIVLATVIWLASVWAAFYFFSIVPEWAFPPLVTTELVITVTYFIYLNFGTEIEQ